MKFVELLWMNILVHQLRLDTLLRWRGPPPKISGTYRTMPLVGFRGLANYHKAAQAELDAKADALANRIDTLKGQGLGVLQAHEKHLDKIEDSINEMNEMVREGSNNAPPL